MPGSSQASRHDLLRIAYFSPLPPARSGIADYSSELLPHLAQYAHITLFAEEPASVSPDLQQQFPILPITSYPQKRWQYDIALYHMGNSALHKAIYAMLSRYPGIVVLHDYVLHHFILDRSVGQGDFSGYSREMGYAYGLEGVSKAWDARRGLRPYIPEGQPEPLNQRVIDLSLGLIVHSHYSEELIRQQRPSLPVAIIPQLMASRQQTAGRIDLDVAEDALVVASAGQVTAAKQLDLALQSFARLRQHVPHAYYLVIGEENDEMAIDPLIQELELGQAVHKTGFVHDLQTFVDWIGTADIVLSLRYPTMGETSATALRALAAGRPLIVFDHGWYSELPDAVAVKVPPLDGPALDEALQSLAQDKARRRRMSQAACDYVANHCQPDDVAAAYINFIHAQLARLRKALT
jgi:glycosyltransferase involved in cell wall biosynthesis